MMVCIYKLNRTEIVKFNFFTYDPYNILLIGVSLQVLQEQICFNLNIGIFQVSINKHADDDEIIIF